MIDRTMKLPDGVTAELVDEGVGARVYHLADRRDYTHHFDTVRIVVSGRIGAYNIETRSPAGWHEYNIETHSPAGWHELARGIVPDGESVPYDAAVLRAVAILYRGIHP
jgi:hypothetical protein